MERRQLDDHAVAGPWNMFLLVLFLCAVSLPLGSLSAAEKLRSPRFDEAAALFADRKLARAIEVAHQAWIESRESFGPEDVRSFEAEGLWLTARIHQKHAAGLPYDDLVQRFLAIREKSIVRRNEAHEMTWRYGKPGKEWPDTKHIILTHLSHPNYFEGIYSPDLAGYLESLPSNRLCVVFEVTYDAVGKTIGYNMIEIAKLTRWKSDWSYGSRRGAGKAVSSPWQYEDKNDSVCPGTPE